MRSIGGDLGTTTHHCRHPRESGDPVQEPMLFGERAKPGLVHWIPAFAGMTVTV